MNMMGMKVSKEDWKLFRERVPDWQEAYMERLEKEYVKYLEGDGLASDKFWGLEKKIKQDKNCPGVQLRLNKSDVDGALTRMVLSGVITEDDLTGFSDELIERVKMLVASMKDIFQDR